MIYEKEAISLSKTDEEKFDIKNNDDYISRKYPIIVMQQKSLETGMPFYKLLFGIVFAAIPAYGLILAKTLSTDTLLYVPFILIGLGLAASGLASIISYSTVKSKGEEYQGKVMGYKTSNEMVHYHNSWTGECYKIIYFLSNLPRGPVIIKCKLNRVRYPFAINSNVTFKNYKDGVIIYFDKRRK